MMDPSNAFFDRSLMAAVGALLFSFFLSPPCCRRHQSHGRRSYLDFFAAHLSLSDVSENETRLNVPRDYYYYYSGYPNKSKSTNLGNDTGDDDDVCDDDERPDV
eukprot:scaffold459_cov184-Amphora_coffeaeformis.AAC.2